MFEVDVGSIQCSLGRHLSQCTMTSSVAQSADGVPIAYIFSQPP
jgi:hypothetical protein